MNQTRAEAIASLTAEGMPYALESGLINGRPCRFFTHAPRTLGQLFADNVSDKTFLVYEDERSFLLQRFMIKRCGWPMRLPVISGSSTAIVLQSPCATTQSGSSRSWR